MASYNLALTKTSYFQEEKMDEKYQRHNGLLQNNCLMVKCKLNNRTYGLNFPENTQGFYN